MKTSKILFLLAASAFVSLFLGHSVAMAIGNPALAPALSGLVFVSSFIPKVNGLVLYEVTPDLSALTTSFVKWGGKILRKHVNALRLGKGITTYRNVTVPVAMTKLSAKGNPRPYRENDDTSGNGAKFTDRTLTVNQSKWDFDVDPEQYRNKYLNDVSGVPFYQFILDQVAKEYYAAINNSVLANGVYNAAGTTAAAIATGWVTLLKALATATTITPVVVGAITSANAVTKVETFAEAQPAWWREADGGFVIKCSYAVFDAYKKHYRATYGFGFNKSENGKYMIDGMANVELEPVSWLSGDGLLGVVFDALAFGTDGDRIQVAASMRRNIIEVRMMLPVGLEIEDLECISVSDNLVA
jgi:hypothetical protein